LIIKLIIFFYIFTIFTEENKKTKDTLTNFYDIIIVIGFFLITDGFENMFNYKINCIYSIFNTNIVNRGIENLIYSKMLSYKNFIYGIKFFYK